MGFGLASECLYSPGLEVWLYPLDQVPHLQLQPGSTVPWGLSSFPFCGSSASLEAIALNRELPKADTEWVHPALKGTCDSH